MSRRLVRGALTAVALLTVLMTLAAVEGLLPSLPWLLAGCALAVWVLWRRAVVAGRNGMR